MNMFYEKKLSGNGLKMIFMFMYTKDKDQCLIYLRLIHYEVKSSNHIGYPFAQYGSFFGKFVCEKSKTWAPIFLNLL